MTRAGIFLCGLRAAAAQSDKADALSGAARKGDAAAVTKLLDDGVDVNTKFTIPTPIVGPGFVVGTISFAA
jgi:hypothetical protein